MRKTVLILLIAVIPFLGQAQDQQSPFYSGKKTADIVLGPWLQAVTEDSFTVVWTTNWDAVGWVELAPDDGSHFFECDRPKYYEMKCGKKTVGKLHKVTVSGLTKGTTYRYRILNQSVITAPDDKRLVFGITSGNDPFRLKPYTVTTRDSEAESCDFMIVNDIHANDSVFRALVGNVIAEKQDFVVFNGDMVSAMDNEDMLFNGYLRSANELFAHNIPFYYNRGNHEGRGLFSYHFLDYFPTSTGETWFMVRQGPCAIIFLDCGEDKPETDDSYFGLDCSDNLRTREAAWLEKAVKTKDYVDAPVKIVVMHAPPQPKGGWHVNAEIREKIMPILEKADVDLMLSGHIHRYEFNEAGKRASFPVLINKTNERHCFHVTA
ncbi:MAG: metallophosphoesterase, partial [Bacteroidales bacterium]|nr:metallophosphoesterase [Bacteroidales bacterium]